MKTAPEIAAEIVDAIEAFDNHHEAAQTGYQDKGVDHSNLQVVRDSERMHVKNFLGDMQFTRTDGQPVNRKDLEQHIAGILANKTQDEVDTFLQQLHNDVNIARTLHQHLNQ
ncbi:hypothetical protein [Mucilaginibacter koreensis]